MTEDSPNDLNLGHFGLPVYDLDSSQWTFARTPYGSGFRQLGKWKTNIPAAIHFPLPHDPQTLRKAQNATKTILQNRPELAPAAEHVPELEAVSAAATSALSTYDATVGQLMSFGSIAPLKRGRGSGRKIVALPTGEGGNILRLQLLVRERHGWAAEEHLRSHGHLEGASLKGDLGFWNEDAAAIQQVCFAQSEELGSFLAVRLPQRTALFRPVYHSRPEAAATSPFYKLPPSVIDVRPFRCLWIDETGGTPHADVAFNPHYQRQFAIVDQKSNWSVWDIEGNRGSYTIGRTASGTMEAMEEVNSGEEAEQSTSWKEDGWARVMWVGDANTILICKRRQLELIDLKQPSRALKIPQVVDWSATKNPSRHWILDIKRHPVKEKQFLILTSDRVYLYSVASMGDLSYPTIHDADAAIIMSWTHFRGAEDVTLQLTVNSTSDEGTVTTHINRSHTLTFVEIAFFIHSRLNSLVTVYRLADQPCESVPYCSLGPTTLRLDCWDRECESKPILNLELSQLTFKDSGTGPRGLGSTYEDRGVRFYQLSAVLDDLSVVQTMLCCLSTDSGEMLIEEVEATTWTKVVRPPTLASILKKTASRDEDDFVVPDGLIDAPNPQLKFGFSPPQLVGPETTDNGRRIYDFSNLYEVLASNHTMAQVTGEKTPETVPISELVDEIKWRLGREENVHPWTVGTLQEYAEAMVTVDDVDEASEKMHSLSIMPHASSLEFRRIASDAVLGFGNGQGEGPYALSSVYDQILQNWVAPLPTSIPVRTRQNKESMARRIAAGIVLGSTRIRHSDSREDVVDSQPETSQDSAVALSSSLPQYSSQSGDSDGPASQPRSTFNASNPLARLSKHLLIGNTSQPEIAPSINQVLSHWQLGTDPSLYDWEATERALEEEIELEEEGSQKRREKARRKKERHVKRQKRENDLFSGRVEAGNMESQPQTLRSSPGPVFATNSSQVHASSQSQAFGGMLGVQSQVEPGKHGGRPAKKKKVKSRMSGF